MSTGVDDPAKRGQSDLDDSFDATVEGILDIVRDGLGLELAFLGQFVEGDELYRLFSGSGEDFALGSGTMRAPLSMSYCKLMVDGVIPEVIPDVAAHPELLALPITHKGRIGAYAGVPVYTPGGDVFGTLCALGHEANDGLSRRDKSFLETLASLVTFLLERDELRQGLARQQLQIDAELERAHRIQRGLLPTAAPATPGLALAGNSRASEKVGGDLYDFIVDPSGRVTIAIADVAGHSIGSALLMALARTALRRELGGGAGPAAALRITGTAIYEDLLGAESFITAACVSYDPADGTCSYASAGHNPLLLVRASGAIDWLGEHGPALGLFEHAEIEEHAIAIAPGDTIVLYTDGVVEAAPAERPDAQFGEDALADTVREARLAPPADVLAEVQGAIAWHLQGAPPADDLTLVVMRRLPGR